MNIKVGDVVPIVLKLDDGSITRFPQASINDGLTNPTLDLAHHINGMYEPATPYVMPDATYVLVSYVIYADAGHTAEITTYSQEMDVFRKIVMADYKADLTSVDATLEIIERLTGHNVTRAGAIITIYEDTDLQIPWRSYDLTNGGRILIP